MDRGLADLARRLGERFASDPAAAHKVVEGENVACLQTIFAAVAQGDFDAAFTHLSPDTSFALYAGGHIPFQLAGEGLAAVQDGMRNNFGAVDFEAIDVDTLAAQGDVVVIVARQRGCWRESTVRFDERIILEYTFRAAKVWRYRAWILPFAS